MVNYGKYARGTPRIVERYMELGRYIPNALYKRIKGRKRCSRCKYQNKKANRFEIHHIVPVSRGGKNIENNLILVCKPCHKKLDAEQEAKYGT